MVDLCLQNVALLIVDFSGLDQRILIVGFSGINNTPEGVVLFNAFCLALILLLSRLHF